jgi:photosystem II stability/assembly factor-like uncharacterized protein
MTAQRSPRPFHIVVASVVAALTLLAAGMTAREQASPRLFGMPTTPGQWVSLAPWLIFGSTSPPNFNSGRIAALAVDPSDSRHWLTGVGNGGVWETRDAGGTWAPLTDQAPTLAIGAVAFAPSNPSIIYAATGEATAEYFTRSGMGMLKSTDGGRTWALIGASSFARSSVRRVYVHPTDPNVVVATTSRGGSGRDSRFGTAGSAPFGVLRSVDGGATWIRTLAGMAVDLVVDPANFNRQYAAIGQSTLGPNGLDLGLGSDSTGSVPNGLYRSTDGGRSWTAVGGPWGTSTPTEPTTARIALAIAPSNANVIYAGMQRHRTTSGGASDLLGLYRTQDAWAAAPAWIQVPTGATGANAYCGGSKCGYTHVLSVDPADPNRLFAAGDRIWRCTDCGSAPVWSIVQQQLHADFHALAWSGNRLIAGTDGGIWSTIDFGTSWQNNNTGLSTLMFYSAALHPTDPNFMVGGLRDFVPAVRIGTSPWTVVGQLPSPGHWGEAEVAISSRRPDTDWMIADAFGGIYRTIDGGRTGIAADAGIDKTSAAFIHPVRKCPRNDDVFLTGANRVWRSNDFFGAGAPTWAANGPPSSFPNSRHSPGTIQAIAFSPSDESCNTYAYGNHAGQIWITRNGGSSWNNLDPAQSLPARPVNSLAFDPANANILYLALSSFDDATPGRPGHVFKTTNATAASPAWANVSPPLNQPFNVIAVDPVNPSLVYAGSDTGLWRSLDGAATWQRVGLESGLPPATVHDIQINPVTKRTVIFTYGRGAYALVPPQ